MSSSDKDWFPPGYRSILDLVDEIGREIHGAAYWPDNRPKELIPPRIAGAAHIPSPNLRQAGAGVPASDDDAVGEIVAATGLGAALAFHDRWYLGNSWWDRCEQHRGPARDRLRTKLAAGEIEAFVLCSVHGDVPIEPKWWRDHAAVKALRTGKAVLVVGVVPIGKAFMSLTASGPVGVRVPPDHKKATARAETELRKWLAKCIRSGRYHSKKQYLQAARASISNLSGAAFDRVWQALAAEPGNSWMTRAGRRKSRRQIE